eukprot:jgi/Astpho2/4793/Aster-00337
MARRLIGPRGVLSKGLNACHTVGGAQISSDTYRGAKVCFVDPKVLYNKSLLQGLLDKKQEHAEAKPWVEVNVPLSFLDKLERPKHDFSELDSPGNVYTFGQDAELFRYNLLGRHTVFSGYSSIVAAEVLYQLRTDNLCAAEPEVRDWAQFGEYMNSNEPAWPKAPFLWAGFILESDVANVYLRQDDGEKLSLRVEAHLEQTD